MGLPGPKTFTLWTLWPTYSPIGMMSLCLCLFVCPSYHGVLSCAIITSCTLPVLRPHFGSTVDLKSKEVSSSVQALLTSLILGFVNRTWCMAKIMMLHFFILLSRLHILILRITLGFCDNLVVHLISIFILTLRRPLTWWMNFCLGTSLSTRAHKGLWSSITAP